MVVSIIVVRSVVVTASCLLRPFTTFILLILKLALMFMKIFPGDALESVGVGALVGLAISDVGFSVLSCGGGVGGGCFVLDLPFFPCLLAFLVRLSCCSTSLPTLAM